MSQFQKYWTPIAGVISAVLLAQQLAQAFTGNRSLVSGLIILVCLAVLGSTLWNSAFAPLTIPGFPRPLWQRLLQALFVVVVFSSFIALSYVLAILSVTPDYFGFVPTHTLTPSPTEAPTATLTLTSTPSLVPTSASNLIYYVVVIDASARMKEAFGEKTKWQAAYDAVNAILEGTKAGAHYSLIVIGGEPTQQGVDPCYQPAVVRSTFSSREVVRDGIANLQPEGGGSLYHAFALANGQFEGLPDGTVRSLIYISGSEDDCTSRNEWEDLERMFQIPGALTADLYSEILIIDENGDLLAQSIPERLSSLSEQIHVSASQNLTVFQQSVTTVINNVNININNEIEVLIARATEFPSPAVIQTNIIASTSPALTSIPFTANPPTSIPPTAAPPTPKPPTPIPPTPLPPTSTLQPSITLLSAEYTGSGEGCSAVITFEVSNGAVTGQFRVWNQWYAENGLPYDPDYVVVTLPVGIDGYEVGLGGNGNPAYYRHEVWFDYNGISSNRLGNLVCPGLVPSP